MYLLLTICFILYFLSLIFHNIFISLFFWNKFFIQSLIACYDSLELSYASKWLSTSTWLITNCLISAYVSFGFCLFRCTAKKLFLLTFAIILKWLMSAVVYCNVFLDLSVSGTIFNVLTDTKKSMKFIMHNFSKFEISHLELPLIQCWKKITGIFHCHG